MFKKASMIILLFGILLTFTTGFAELNSIYETKEWVKTLDQQLTEQGKEELINRLLKDIQQVKESMNNVNLKFKVENLNEVILMSIGRLDGERAITVLEKYSEVLSLYLNKVDTLKADGQMLINKYIQMTGKEVIIIENINLEQAKSIVFNTILANVELQGRVTVANQVTFDEDNLNEFLISVEKAHRMTGLQLEEFQTFYDLKRKLYKMVVFDVANDSPTQIILSKSLVTKLQQPNMKLMITHDGIKYEFSVPLEKSITKNSVIAISPVSVQTTFAKLSDGNGTLKAVYNISSEQLSDKVKVKIPVNMFKENLLAVEYLTLGVKKDGMWSKVPYHLEKEKMVAEVPSEAIIGVMSYNPQYMDIKGHWAEKMISSLLAQGVVKGDSQTNFNPNEVIRRGEFVEMLVKIAGPQGKTTNIYKDISEGSSYSDIIGDAIHYGFTTGATRDSFYPDKALMREDMATMYMTLFEVMNGYFLETDIIRFKDTNDIAPYALDAVKAMKKAEFISGYSDNTFRPKNSVIRSEAIAVLFKMLNR